MDPSLFGLYNFESTGQSSYNGMIVEVHRRLGCRFALTGSYTFSKAIDDVTDFNPDLAALDQTNLLAERALSSFDQKTQAGDVWPH